MDAAREAEAPAPTPLPATPFPGAPGGSLPGLAGAAVASIGAGAIHAAAAGMHAGHDGLAGAMIAASVFQIGWGFLALWKPSRALAGLGAAGNAACAVAWLVTRLRGVSFVDGLEAREPAGFADTVAALLGAAAATGAALAWLVGARRREPLALGPASLAVALLAVPAMVSATSSSHAHDAAHEHDATTATTLVHDHAAGVAVPYDPTLPIDLGGTPGVSPQQQATAENLLAVTLARLPQWADPATAESAGYHTIGDGFSGYEHYVDWTSIDDDTVLDPDRPESLVYRWGADGSRTLVSAMFVLPPSVAITDVPDIGGALVQWHVHGDLCFDSDPVAPQFVSTTRADGTCPSGLRQPELGPMVHVWIVPNECGPFAALEGVAAGQVAPGETPRCDSAHGLVL